MLKGIDLGYSYTKDNDKNMFKSSFTRDDIVVSNGYEVEIDGIKYFAGTGTHTIDIDKTESEITKVLFLTDLAISPDNNFYIVTGLPITQFKSQKDKLKQSLVKCDKTKVKYNNMLKTIAIQGLTVFPQGVGALYSAEIKNDALIIDIGGYTIDIALFEYLDGQFNLIKSDSLYKGTLVLYNSVIKTINNQFQQSFAPDYAQHILTKGLKINGKPQNLDCLKPTLIEYIQPIISEILLHYPIRSTDVYLAGGGAYLLGEVFQECIPNTTILPNSQFANAIGFYKVAQQLYGKYEVERIERKCSTWQL